MRLLYRLSVLALLSAFITALGGPAARAQEAPPAAQAVSSQIYLPLVARPAGGSAPATRPQVQLTFDPGRAVGAQIGPEGGVVQATAANGAQIELSIPPDALDATELVTVTPALAAEGLPLSGGIAGAARIEPLGLTFDEPAMLTIASESPLAAPVPVGFAVGDEFYLMPTDVTAGLQVAGPAITTPIIQTGAYGASSGTSIDLDMLRAAARPFGKRAQLYEAVVLVKERAELGNLLREYYNQTLADEFEAAMATSAGLDSALSSFSVWLELVERGQLSSVLAEEIADGKIVLAAATGLQATNAAERCYKQKRPEESFRLLRWLHYAKKYQLRQSLIDELEGHLSRCLRFQVTFSSIVTVRTGNSGYDYKLRATATLQSAGGSRAVGTGPLTWVDYRFVGNTGPCTFITSGTGSTLDAQSSNFGLRLMPVSRTSPEVKIALRYNTGRPQEHLTVQCPTGTTVVPPTTAWADYFTNLHAYEYDLATKSINTTTQVVNVGTFTGWAYHNTLNQGGEVVEYSQIEVIHSPQAPPIGG